jgi:glycosyl-4,4'-diaponeurosporenoate acyltransferase
MPSSLEELLSRVDSLNSPDAAYRYSVVGESILVADPADPEYSLSASLDGAAHTFRLAEAKPAQPTGPRRFEAGGGWYRRRLRIHRWKDRLPEAGGMFEGGVSKRALPGHDVDGLTLFVRETRRAELAHWWALCCSPLFVLWNPPLAAGLLVAYGVLVNLPFILIQRYNRFRTQSLVRRLTPRGSDA